MRETGISLYSKLSDYLPDVAARYEQGARSAKKIVGANTLEQTPADLYQATMDGITEAPRLGMLSQGDAASPFDLEMDDFPDPTEKMFAVLEKLVPDFGKEIPEAVRAGNAQVNMMKKAKRARFLADQFKKARFILESQREYGKIILNATKAVSAMPQVLGIQYTGMELGIEHGGWIPKGRKTENGILPAKYKLQEMPTTSYPKRTEQNILDSDGTLIISHGKLTGGAALTEKLANKHSRRCLYVDLNKTNGFKAAVLVNSWLIQDGIEVLNVAGPRASKDPDIYKNTKDILKTVINLDIVQDSMPDLLNPPLESNKRLDGLPLPRTVGEAIERLISEMPLKVKVILANMKEVDLISLHPTLGVYIQGNFRLWSGNEELMKSCRSMMGEDEIHEDSASQLIISKLWEKLREGHLLRVIK